MREDGIIVVLSSFYISSSRRRGFGSSPRRAGAARRILVRVLRLMARQATAGEPLDCATVLWPTDPATWGEDARTRVTTELGLAAPAPPGWVVVPLTNSGGDDAGTGGLLYYNINTHSYYRPQPGPIGNLSARPPADNRPLREDEHASGRGDPDYKAGCVRVVYSVTDGCCRWE